MVLDGLWKSLKAFNDAQKDKAKKKEKYMSELKPESKEMYEYYMLQFPLTATAQGLMEEGDFTLGKKARGGRSMSFWKAKTKMKKLKTRQSRSQVLQRKRKKHKREPLLRRFLPTDEPLLKDSNQKRSPRMQLLGPPCLYDHQIPHFHLVK